MPFGNQFSSAWSNAYDIAPAATAGGGSGASGRRPVVVQEPPRRQAELPRVQGLPRLVFDLGTVTVALRLYTEASPLVLAPRPVVELAAPHVPAQYVLPVTMTTFHFVVGISVLHVEPADDPDELFVLGLT